MVSFGSAPGVPNWGGLLPRVRKAAQEPAHECFDVLYVVDATRSWYSGEASCRPTISEKALHMSRFPVMVYRPAMIRLQ